MAVPGEPPIRPGIPAEEKPTEARPLAQTPSVAAAPSVPSPPGALDPEARALAALFGDLPERLDVARADPDAFLLSPRPTPAEIQALQAEVRELGNRELRRRAIATRDAADLAEDPLRRRGHLAAWQGLREIARRRGLDLDTGLHDPKRATDAAEASRHTDSALLPEEEARLRGRGREAA
jgi:hypothetical protein